MQQRSGHTPASPNGNTIARHRCDIGNNPRSMRNIQPNNPQSVATFCAPPAKSGSQPTDSWGACVMSSDWIIIGAVLVLFAGVVLVFRTAAQDAPPDKKPTPKPTDTRAVTDS